MAVGIIEKERESAIVERSKIKMKILKHEVMLEVYTKELAILDKEITKMEETLGYDAPERFPDKFTGSYNHYGNKA